MMLKALILIGVLLVVFTSEGALADGAVGFGLNRNNDVVTGSVQYEHESGPVSASAGMSVSQSFHGGGPNVGFHASLKVRI